MPGPEQEVPLRGGRTTPGVVRVGGTVRRPRGPNAAFAADLLRHLERVGFAGAPRWLGVDARGRDVLTYLEGEVPADLGWHADAALADAARLLRAYHDATVGFAPVAEVVCHNDLSPCNAVFAAGRPVALIDFDAAAPGSRAWDLGYAAWLWLDLGRADADPAEQRRRLAAFVAAYGPGGPDARAVASAALERQRVLVLEGERQGRADLAGWAASCLAWTARHLAP